jgi:hypothetical protein
MLAKAPKSYQKRYRQIPSWPNLKTRDSPDKSEQAQCARHNHETDNPHRDKVGYTFKGAPNPNVPPRIIAALLFRRSLVSPHATRVPGPEGIGNGSFVEIDPLSGWYWAFPT